MTSTPASADVNSRNRWLIFLALVILAFAWRLPHAVHSPIVQVDEVKYTMPTVQRFLAHDPVPHIAGTNYGLPAEQALASVLFRAFGESAGAFRLPTVLLGSIAVGVFFLALRRTAGTRAALFITIPLALANSSVARYTTFSHGSYSVLLLMTGLIQIATLRVDEKRTAARWIVLGAAMGTGLHALKLAIFQCAASLVWLWLRSGHFQRVRERMSDAGLRRRLCAAIITAALGFAALVPVLYRFLTRRSSFTVSPLEKWLVIAAAILCAAGAAIALPAIGFPQMRECAPVAAALAIMVAVPLPAALWFRKIELPKLEAMGVEPYAEASYSFKHLHEWPNQARLVVEGVFPALLVGRWNEVRGFEERETLGWKSAITAALSAAVAFGCVRRWRSGKWRPGIPGADFIFIAPFFITLLVLFPSWSLHSESSFRYVLPFLPGLLLLLYRAAEQGIAAHPRIAAALIGLYAAYSAFDCWFHIA